MCLADRYRSGEEKARPGAARSDGVTPTGVDRRRSQPFPVLRDAAPCPVPGCLPVVSADA